MKKLVLVDCLSQFRIRYVVEVEDDIDHALDEVIMRENDGDFQEFSQVHLGHISTAHREISKEQYEKAKNTIKEYEYQERNKLPFEFGHIFYLDALLLLILM